MKSKVGKIAEGVDTASELKEAGEQIGEGIITIADQFDPDTTFITTRATTIETQVVHGNQVSSIGNVENIEVTVPKSQADSVINTDNLSLERQAELMDRANFRVLDSLIKANNGN